MTKNEFEKLSGVLESYMNEECEKIKIIEDYEFSDDFKRNINKIFAEYIGPERIPYPEVEK